MFKMSNVIDCVFYYFDFSLLVKLDALPFPKLAHQKKLLNVTFELYKIKTSCFKCCQK